MNLWGNGGIIVRKIKSKEKTKKFEETIKELRYGTQVAECILKSEDENECSGKIIEAHSIQNNRFLKKIAQNGDIYYLKIGVADDDKLMFEFEKKGRKSFSTFRGFCKKHDKELFQPIEDREYTETDEQNFLFAFRAFAREMHAKKESVLYFKNMSSLDNLNMSSFLGIIDILTKEELTLKLFTEELKIFKMAIKEKKYDCIYTYKIILEKEYPIVCNSTFIPYVDANFNSVFSDEEYNKIQLGELNPNIFLNVFPANNKTYILLSCLEKNKDILKKFFESLFDKQYIKEKISSLILHYAENTGFSPEYINKYFLEEELNEIKNLYQKTLENTLYTGKTQINLFRDISLK